MDFYSPLVPLLFYSWHARLIFDFHVHMGQYFDDYYTPPRILRTLRLAGITHFAYSSTSTVVTDDPDFLLEERVAMHELSERLCQAFFVGDARYAKTLAKFVAVHE